ncbi:MAG: ankyrin repeat domain-containing protein, partial [Gemmatimonas sp.]
MNRKRFTRATAVVLLSSSALSVAHASRTHVPAPALMYTIADVATLAPVADAAMKGDLASVRVLLDRGSDVNAPQGDGMTALHWAAYRGDSALANLLLLRKASVSAVTCIGRHTPLHVAAENGSSAVVRLLLRAKADA